MGCASVEEGLRCCVETYGRGLDTGSAAELDGCEGGDCDPLAYLSAEAAVCAAQVQGLDPGISRCAARFDLTAEHGGRWGVSNVLETGCTDDVEYADQDGEGFYLYGRTGEGYGVFQETALVACHRPE